MCLNNLYVIFKRLQKFLRYKVDIAVIEIENINIRVFYHYKEKII